MWPLLFLILLARADDVPDKDDETSRKILGSSVVTSVSVIMDAGNGSKIYSDAVGNPVSKPATAANLASPIALLSPDRYEFYTFDDTGDLVKRLMTLEEIHDIIATGDDDGFILDANTNSFIPEKRVNDVVNNVQNVLKEEIKQHKNPEKPEFDTPDVSDNWSMILPAVFGNSGESISAEIPLRHSTPDTIMVEPTTTAPVINVEIITNSNSTTEKTVNVEPEQLQVVDQLSKKNQELGALSTKAPVVTTFRPSKKPVIRSTTARSTSQTTTTFSTTPSTTTFSTTPSTTTFSTTPSTTTVSTTQSTTTFSTTPSTTTSSTTPSTTTVSTTPSTTVSTTPSTTTVSTTPSTTVSTTPSTTTVSTTPLTTTVSTTQSTTTVSTTSSTTIPTTTELLTTAEVSTTPEAITTTQNIATTTAEQTTTVKSETTTEQLSTTTDTTTTTIEPQSTFGPLSTFFIVSDNKEKNSIEDDLSTLSTEYVTTKFPKNSILSTTETQSTELEQLLLTSTNIYEINSELSEIKSTTSFDDSTTKSEQAFVRLTNPTEVPSTTTDQSFIDTIEQLISQAVGTVPPDTVVPNQAAIIEALMKNSTNKTMPEMVLETATIASSLLDVTTIEPTTVPHIINITIIRNENATLPKPAKADLSLEIEAEKLYNELKKNESLTTVVPSIDIKIDEKNDSWTLVSTIAPPNEKTTEVPVDLVPKPLQGFGLEDSTKNLDPDLYQFVQLCNELAFGFWKSVTHGLSSARSIVVSPFAATSLLSMVFLGARGSTSGEMNEILKLDDMVTFNPHLIFKNVSESILDSGSGTSTIIRELYSDRSRGKLLGFYKERVRQFYDGHVEEVSFKEIGDVIRRRTNLLVKKGTNGKMGEFLKDGSIVPRAPLAGVSISIFQTDCSQASTNDRDGELHFVVLPSLRQRKLIPIPAIVYRSGFLAGYEPSLDATTAALGTKDQTISTIFIIPGQQGSSAPGDGLARLEKRLLESAFQKGAWSRLLRALIPRPGLELQLPRFQHRSVLNASQSLIRMGLHDLFDSQRADLKGLNGAAHELYLSDVVQINEFATCGEARIGETHHKEVYPATVERASRLLVKPKFQRGYVDPLHDPSLLSLPLALRPRQARLPEVPRLRFDRPFLYFVRHNPSGLILHMGRFHPRLLP